MPLRPVRLGVIVLLDVHHVHKSYQTEEGSLAVLRGVSFRLGNGESLALTGESGSGKSTLLHLVAGLDKPDAGRVLVDGDDIAGLDDNGRAAVRRGPFHARLAGRHDAGWTRMLADRLGLSSHLTRYPEQLSGGQQQRVAIGRTLAARPPLVLADEPTGNLDEDTGDAVLDLLLGLVREAGAGLLLVTHSARLAARLDRHLNLAHGQVA